MRRLPKKAMLPSPRQIKEHLDQYIIGQEEAKKSMSVAVYNHYKRLFYNSTPVPEADTSDKVNIEKSNIVLLGKTGCGKTLIAKTIADYLGVPCYIQDTTKLTASGYVGEDVENCLVGLLRACDYDMGMAELGIVVLDEGDKMAKKESGVSVTRDVSGECVQQSLLKMVEGDVVGVPPSGGRKHPEQPLLYVDTRNILFIISGAFVGLEEIIKKRIGTKKFGFETEDDTIKGEDYARYASPEDLKEFGLIPELVGRFPIITSVEPLDSDDLVRILTEPKNAIVKQYKALMGVDNINLEFTDDALREIGELAIHLETGARGLRSIMECVLGDIMFEGPKSRKKKYTVTADMVKERTKAKFSWKKVS